MIAAVAIRTGIAPQLLERSPAVLEEMIDILDELGRDQRGDDLLRRLKAGM